MLTIIIIKIMIVETMMVMIIIRTIIVIIRTSIIMVRILKVITVSVIMWIITKNLMNPKIFKDIPTIRTTIKIIKCMLIINEIIKLNQFVTKIINNIMI